MWVGILINVFFVILFEVCYGKELMTKNWALYDVTGYVLMNFCGLISGLFLGDSLRRIYSTYRSNESLKKNQKIMIAHLVVFFIFIVTTGLKTFQVSRWLFNLSDQAEERLGLIYYVVSLYFQFVDQVVLCYLFFESSHARGRVIDISSDGSIMVST